MPRGRPTKYNQEIAERIIADVRRGSSREEAAGAAGIAESTLRRWMDRYADFRARVHEADAWAVKNAEQAVYERDPLRWLQAKRPEVWGNLGRQRIEVSGPEGGPLDITHAIDTGSIIAVARWLEQREAESEAEPE